MNIFSRPNWFVYDICGILCMILTELLLLYSALILNFFFIKKFLDSGERILFIFNLILCNSIYIICSFCHLSCTTTDPGVMPNNGDKGEILLPIELQTQTVSIRSCAKCNNLKPPRTHHCSVCKRCIFKMDHHCPWINNCVGINNQKHFLLFLAYVFLFCAYSLILICIRFYKCISYSLPNPSDINDSYLDFQLLSSTTELLNFNQKANETPYYDCTITPISFILGFSVIIEGLIFGIFCIAMFVDQVICIINNTTGIEHLKQEYLYSKKKSAYSLFIQVFGSKFSWRWFLPTMTRPPFTTSNFDISKFLDFEFGDLIIDPETGFDCDQSKQDIQSYDSSILFKRMKSNRISCCFICEGIDSSNMSIPNVSEDFSIFENEVRKGGTSNPSFKEILMDDLHR
ncbi:unnamed protein product [Cryptosporidium hominis]|uniref:Palmitoyltransferase n=1 Tax=Cryptosporidium hominis TaxID=237895 RepID=A0A0S4TBK2_CRYHO|nr:DHHC1 protein; Golgi apparatus-specific protein with DHHC zinc finger domain [Cryptosporidium hominis TU502]PPS95118.1 DHHC palmitoyltransferase [Cryptosporidium hominis]CUV04575.1 unnamed protein product [Cryptosporidium hominis]|eukprot:PPS95118.1 DHHC palmitoyltransferase [Cryptosporidium hominis]